MQGDPGFITVDILARPTYNVSASLEVLTSTGTLGGESTSTQTVFLAAFVTRLSIILSTKILILKYEIMCNLACRPSKGCTTSPANEPIT